MEAVEFQGLVDQLSVTAGQREALIEAVRLKASASDAVSLIDRRFAAAPRCPHCKSAAVGTWSKPKPLTRYRCHDCRRTFTGLTGPRWSVCVVATPGSTTPRHSPTASACASGQALWHRARHLLPPGGTGSWTKQEATAVSGMVEVDETYFLRSQKGGRKVVGRKARKRGGKASKPGLGRARCGADRARPDRGDHRRGARQGRHRQHHPAPGRGRAKGHAADQRRREGLWRVRGGARASARVDHRLESEHVWRGYHIQNVNAYTSGSRHDLRGVATKYLDSYLGCAAASTATATIYCPFEFNDFDPRDRCLMITLSTCPVGTNNSTDIGKTRAFVVAKRGNPNATSRLPVPLVSVLNEFRL